MEKFRQTIIDSEGNIIPLATVNVYDTGTTNSVSIFSDDGVTPESNPFTTGTDAVVKFYAADGRYDVKITKTGFDDILVVDQQLFDRNITGATGGIDNLGSTTIGADSDNNGSGDINLKIGGSTQVQLKNNGDFVIDTNGFYYDKSSGNSGHGLSNPGARMHVLKSTDGPVLKIENTFATFSGILSSLDTTRAASIGFDFFRANANSILVARITGEGGALFASAVVIGAINPDSGTILDLVSSEKALRLPNLDTAGRASIVGKLGMFAYDIDAKTIIAFKATVSEPNGEWIDLDRLPRSTTAFWHTLNGFGSSSTKIQKFSTEVESSDDVVVTIINSATLGFNITANMPCEVFVGYSFQQNAPRIFGISLNSSQLTTDFQAITTADRRITGQTFGADQTSSVSCTVTLNTNDVLRPHVEAGVDGSTPNRGNIHVFAREIL